MQHQDCIMFILMIKKISVSLFILCLFQASLQAQTVGLLKNDPGSFDGYTMIGKSGTTYLLDQSGQVVNTWVTGNSRSHPGYLMDNGDLIAVFQGIKRFTWEGNLIWEYSNSSAHHDVAVMPNGHVLFLIRGLKTNAEVLAAGRDPNLLEDDIKPMVIYEVDSAGNIVWQWHVWDHLIQDFDISKDNYGVVADQPELVDINFAFDGASDWLHSNAIDYNPELDQIMVSVRYNSEIWIIDHSTTTAQAAGHTGGLAGKGGDLLYRWGNPVAYRAGDQSDQQTYGSHDAHWISDGLPGAGRILLFNNGGFTYGGDGEYSTIDEFIPPLNGFNYDLVPGNAYLPSMPDWTYIGNPRESFYSSYISSVQRLPNGNTFIDEGAYGYLFEVTDGGDIVWQYQNPVVSTGILTQGDPAPIGRVGSLFRAYKYAKNHPGLIGKDLLPQGTIENYNVINELNISSPLDELILNPGVGVFNMGESQLVPLIAQELSGYQFTDWTVTGGNIVINNPNDLHTSFVMSDTDAAVQANYVFIDLIFIDGFEQ